MRRLAAFLVLALALWSVAAPAMAQGSSNAYFGEDWRVKPGETVDGDVAVFGGRATLERGGRLNGDLAVIVGSARVEGTVNGDLVVFGGSLVLGTTAVVEGDVVALGAFERATGAQVHGSVVRGLAGAEALTIVPALGDRPRVSSAPWVLRQMAAEGLRVVRWFAGLLSVALLAVVAALVIPDNLRRVSGAMRVAPWQSLGIGLLTVLLYAVLLPLLVIICVGIPVAIVLAIALALAALLGWISAGELLGARLLAAAKMQDTGVLVHTLMGVFVLSLLGLVPCVGWLLSFALMCWGLGASVLTRAGIREAAFYLAPVAPTSSTSASTVIDSASAENSAALQAARDDTLDADSAHR